MTLPMLCYIPERLLRGSQKCFHCFYYMGFGPYGALHTISWHGHGCWMPLQFTVGFYRRTLIIHSITLLCITISLNMLVFLHIIYSCATFMWYNYFAYHTFNLMSFMGFMLYILTEDVPRPVGPFLVFIVFCCIKNLKLQRIAYT